MGDTCSRRSQLRKAKASKSEARHVVFLVDGDKCGLDNKEKLVAGGIDSEHVVVLSDTAAATSDADPANAEALETEDLITAAWQELGSRSDNSTTTSRHHRLKGRLASGVHCGVEMEQWQYDAEKRTLWLRHAGPGHPSATD
jgi:hypothetical protein